MELKDSLNNRVVKAAPPPLQGSLEPTQLLPGGQADYKLLLKFYKRQGRLSKGLYLELIKRAKAIFQKQSNIVKVNEPVTIVGDIHGQFYDLAYLIQQAFGSSLGTSRFVFLGDYVDRGSFSVEVVGILLALKIKFKDTVFMLRGNHESRTMTSSFNFRSQCLQKYDQDIYQAIIDLFDCLPLAAVVNNKFLCVHGGISPLIQTLSELEKVKRFREIPRNGVICDLVWSDPIDNETGKLTQLVKYNDARGCSYYYGYNLAKSFLISNGFSSIIRAHQVQNDGYKPYFWGGQNQLPTVITVFSAPNYCDFYNNKGAILKIKDNSFQIKQFTQVQHPYLLPDFMNLFQWSMPFVSQKISQMLYYLIKPDMKQKQQDMLPLFMIQQKEYLEKSLECLRHITKEHTQNLHKEGRILDNKLLKTEGALKEIKQHKQTTSFERKRTLDLQNEKRPIVLGFQEENEVEDDKNGYKMIQI